MAKRKLERFAALETFKNIVQFSVQDITTQAQSLQYKNKWAENIFHNNHPIILELGCGKGEYTIGLAEKYPEKNFIGIDMKGDRLWRGCTRANEKKLTNAFFIRTPIEFIENIFGENEIAEIWITFPDPQLNKSRIKKRLTSPPFLQKYYSFLAKDGIIHLKTDNIPFFDYTLNIIQQEKHKLLYYSYNLYQSNYMDDILSIKTYYEEKFTKKGMNICYVKFMLKEDW